MNKTTVTIISIFTFFLFIGLIYFFLGVSAHNFSNNKEKTLIALDKQSQNVLSSTTNKVRELFSLRDEHYKGLENIIRANLEGRYGDEGSKAVFQFLQEQNLAPNPELDNVVAQELRAGRNSFENYQKMKIDVVRSYKTAIDSYFQGYFIKQKGFPKINLDDYDIIINSSVKEKFEKRVDDEIKLR